MSTFNETITLTNTGDVSAACRGLIPEAEIRSVTLDACVDTAATAINSYTASNKKEEKWSISSPGFGPL